MAEEAGRIGGGAASTCMDRRPGYPFPCRLQADGALKVGERLRARRGHGALAQIRSGEGGHDLRPDLESGGAYGGADGRNEPSGLGASSSHGSDRGADHPGHHATPARVDRGNAPGRWITHEQGHAVGAADADRRPARVCHQRIAGTAESADGRLQNELAVHLLRVGQATTGQSDCIEESSGVALKFFPPLRRGTRALQIQRVERLNALTRLPRAEGMHEACVAQGSALEKGHAIGRAFTEARVHGPDHRNEQGPHACA